MTVSSATSNATLVCNGATKVFDIPFRFFENGHIKATRVTLSTGVETPMTLGIDYTLTGANLPEINGQAVGKLTTTAAAAYAATERIVIERVMPVTQQTSLINQGSFLPQIHENVFDRAIMLIQQVFGSLTSSLRLNLLGRYDAQDRRIIRLADPAAATDAANKGYIDTLGDWIVRQLRGESDAKEAKALRAPETLALLPDAAGRAGKLLSFDAAGAPLLRAPSTDSVDDYAALIAADSGAASVGTSTGPLDQRLTASDRKTPEITIAVVGDSLSVDNNLGDPSWPARLERILGCANCRVRVLNFSANGMSYFRANTIGYTGGPTGGMTIAQAVVAAKPDVVLLALGTNDTISTLQPLPARTVEQVIDDASTFVATIRAGSPATKIVSSYMLLSDPSITISAALKNHSICPAYWTKAASGLKSLGRLMDLATDTVSTNMIAMLAGGVSLRAHVESLADASYQINLFRIARMGLMSPDLVHLSSAAHAFAAGYAYKGLQANAAAISPALGRLLSTKELTHWQDPDDIFSMLFTAASGVYTRKVIEPHAEIMFRQHGVFAGGEAMWGMRYRASLCLSHKTLPKTHTLIITIRGARAHTQIEQIGDTGAVIPQDLYTNASGDILWTIYGGYFTNGIHQMRFRVGDDVYGPIQVTAVD